MCCSSRRIWPANGMIFSKTIIPSHWNWPVVKENMLLALAGCMQTGILSMFAGSAGVTASVAAFFLAFFSAHVSLASTVNNKPSNKALI